MDETSRIGEKCAETDYVVILKTVALVLRSLILENCSHNINVSALYSY